MWATKSLFGFGNGNAGCLVHFSDLFYHRYLRINNIQLLPPRISLAKFENLVLKKKGKALGIKQTIKSILKFHTKTK